MAAATKRTKFTPGQTVALTTIDTTATDITAPSLDPATVEIVRSLRKAESEFVDRYRELGDRLKPEKEACPHGQWMVLLKAYGIDQKEWERAKAISDHFEAHQNDPEEIVLMSNLGLHQAIDRIKSLKPAKQPSPKHSSAASNSSQQDAPNPQNEQCITEDIEADTEGSDARLEGDLLSIDRAGLEGNELRDLPIVFTSNSPTTAMKRFRVFVPVDVEISEAHLQTILSPEWADSFYSFDSEEDAVRYVAALMIKGLRSSPLSNYDGHADQSSDVANVELVPTNDEDWEDVARN